MAYLDDSWTEAGSVSTIYKMDGHNRYFITAAQVESVLSPYGFLASAYTTTVNGASGYVVSGQIASNQSARADYINTTHYELPDSGGSGADCFLFLGIGLLALFACCLYIRLYKKKNAPDSNRFSSSSKN